MPTRVERESRNGAGVLGGSGEDTLSCYFADIRSVRREQPLLTAENEKRLARRIEAGKRAKKELTNPWRRTNPTREKRLLTLKKAGDDARERFIRANLGLVIPIAEKNRERGLPFSDLIQEGNLGLIRAVEGFDWRMGTRFSTYAIWWIRQAIGRAVSDQGRTIRVPIHAQEDIKRLAKTTQALTNILEREPTSGEIAAEMGVGVERIEELRLHEQRKLPSIYNLVSPGEDGDEAVWVDFIRDPDPLPEEVMEEKERREETRRLLQHLYPIERRCVELRYGLDNGGEKRTLREVGDVLGFTRERARQVLTVAEAKLRGDPIPIKKQKRRRKVRP